MNIGLLNNLLSPTLSFYKTDGTVPTPKIEGDPLRGEPLLVRWQDLMEEPLFLAIQLGEEAFVSGDPEALAKADRLVLPGVGAFEDAASLTVLIISLRTVPSLSVSASHLI